MRLFTLCISVVAVFFSVSAFSAGLASSSPDGAGVYFINLKDGQTVSQEFTVKFGLTGMGVSPAGFDKDNTGHHHLLIDTDISSLDMTQSLPATDKVKHFGGGQTETVLSLTPGKHTLQLVLGNYLHVPHNKPVTSKKINITVK